MTRPPGELLNELIVTRQQIALTRQKLAELRERSAATGVSLPLPPDIDGLVARLVPMFRPPNEIVGELLAAMLMLQLLSFPIQHVINPLRPNRDLHRKQIRGIAINANKLLTKLEVFNIRALLYGQHSGLSTKNKSELSSQFKSTLTDLAANATRALEDEKFFAFVRGYYGTGDGRKNYIRRELWEPLFEQYTLVGHAVPKSDSGPILRILDVCHEALGLPPVVPNTLQKAIIGWHARRGTQPAKKSG